MDYLKHYENLIERAKDRESLAYTEEHHIWPRCLGGADERWNLVNLTPEEHYVAHQLLVKAFPEEPKLVWATIQMTGHKNGQRNNNKVYGWLKRKNQKIAKARTGPKNGSYGRYWFYNPETMESKKLDPNEVPEGWIKGRGIKNKRFSMCQHCGQNTNLFYAKWCDACKDLRKQSRGIQNNKSTSCAKCGTDTNRKKSKYCDRCRYSRADNYNYYSELYVEFLNLEMGYKQFVEYKNLNTSHVALYNAFKRHGLIPR